MFDVLARSSMATASFVPVAPARTFLTPPAAQPAHGAAALPDCPPWLSATLDEIDYGLVLVGAGGLVAHINHTARAELDAGQVLRLRGRELHASLPSDALALSEALEAASRRGLRRMIVLGRGEQRTSVAVVPLPAVEGAAPTLVMFGKRSVCETLSVQGFARCHGLTAAETRVLLELCRGTPPGQIASGLGVAISTIRTQIGNMRQKTGAQSIRALVRQVAVLPPMVSALRCGAMGAQA